MKRPPRAKGVTMMPGAKPQFLNVDLLIESTVRLDSLSASMGKQVFVLSSTPTSRGQRHLLALESSKQHKGPDATIRALCDIVEALTPAARHIWNRSKKEFDVGYELRAGEKYSRFTLGADTLQRVASSGANLAVTYYRRANSHGNPSASPITSKKIKS